MPGVETGYQAPKPDYRSQLGKFVGDRLHLPPPNIPLRRRIAGQLLEHTVWPVEKPITIHDNAIQRAEQLMRDEGYGLVVAINHWSARDPMEAIKDIMNLSDYFKTRGVVAPIGYHQWMKILPPLGRFFGIDTYRVVTPHTLSPEVDGARKNPSLLERAKTVFEYHMQSRLRPETAMTHEEYHERMKGRHLTFDETKQGRREYLEATADALGRGDMVILAPEAERGNKLREFKGGPIQMIVRETKNRGFDKIAFLVIGLGERGRTTYEKSGFRFFKDEEVEIAGCFTLQEANEEIQIRDAELQNSLDNLSQQRKGRLRYTIDALVHDTMLEVIPQGFRPEGN